MPVIRLFLATIWVLLAAACCAVQSGPQRATAFRMETGIGLCSATAVGPHTILTASHCLSDGTRRIALDGEASDVVAMVNDGMDHTLVRVEDTFHRWVPIGSMPSVGSEVTFTGQPDGIFGVFRKGYFAGRAVVQSPDWPAALPPGTLLFVIEGTHGDSGAGIFAQGQLVAVVSGGYQSIDGFRLMWSRPLAFTARQWHEAQT
jgi:hypothetical protein